MDAGDPILAEDVLVARLNANISLATGSTALQNVTGLGIAVPANTVYLVEMSLQVLNAAGTTEDIKFGATFPAGASLRLCAMGGSATGVAAGASTEMNVLVQNLVSGTTTFAFGASTSTTNVVLRGVLTMGSTAGTLQVQAAQNTSGANVSSVRVESYMLLTRIA